MKRIIRIAFCAFAVALFACCNPEKDKIKTDDKEKEEEKKEDELSEEVQKTRFYVNTFAYNVMNVYYLWCDEIKDDLEAWEDYDEPIAKVKQIRYKENGKDVDRWTQMTDDYEGFTSSVAGVSVTYGYDVTLYRYDAQGTICAVITYVYPDSPAEKAGIMRGDIVLLVNGNKMNTITYVNQVNNEMFNSETVKLTMSDGKEYNLVAVEMYEDPVLVDKVFEVGEKKVGYLHYTSFTLKSCEHLYEVFESFKKAGIEEIILDLRYNGGGYVLAQQFIASVLAPYASVQAGDVLEKEIYNKTLTDAWGADSDTKLSFTHEITIDKEKRQFNTEPINLGVKKIYAILGSGSASASESLLTCLMPYVPITIVGEQSHGKFCTGIMYGSEEWYEDSKKYISSAVYKAGMQWTKNWGIYVMIGRFADKYGNTPCMPDGFKPDYAVEDDPTSPYQLGKEKEPMLEYTLNLISGATKSSTPSKRMAGRPDLKKADYQRTRPEFGLYVSPSLHK